MHSSPLKKTFLNLRTFLMLVLDVALAIVLLLYLSNTGTIPAADGGAAGYMDGLYTASAQGCVSEVSVSVTITAGKVTKVDINASGETPALGGAAAELLSAQLLEAGSPAGVDAVSGSTMTSEAIFAAMEDCLAQAAAQ